MPAIHPKPVLPTRLATCLLALLLTAAARAQHEGIALAEQDTRLSFTVAGSVEKTLVKPGDTVKADQPLVELEDRVGLAQIAMYEMRAASTLAIDAAEKEWKLAQVEETLIREALAKGSAGQFEVDKAQLSTQLAFLRLELARQNRKEAEQQLQQYKLAHEQRTLRSPISGIIEEITVSPGEGVEAQKPILRVVNTDTLRIEVHPPTSETLGLQRGDTVWVEFGAAPASSPKSSKPAATGSPNIIRVDGTITQVASVADARSDTRLVRISVTNPGNMPAGVQVKVWLRPVIKSGSGKS